MYKLATSKDVAAGATGGYAIGWLLQEEQTLLVRSYAALLAAVHR